MFEFESSGKDLWTEYLNFLRWLHEGDKSSYLVHNRNYLRDVRWIVSNFMEGDIDLDRFGYSPVKLRLLKKAYENVDSLTEGTAILERQLEKKKKYISASFSLMTGVKSQRLKSYCMNSFVFMKDPHITRIIISYRVTEAIKKFGADLVFLRYLFDKYIPGELLDEVEQVIFQFSLLYVVPIYYPLVYTFGIRVPKNGNNWFHEACIKQLERADDLSIIPKYSQTERVFRTYREGKEGGKKNE